MKEISVYETLREHKEEYLYYRTDHHWTTLGAWYAFLEARQVMGIEAGQELDMYLCGGAEKIRLPLCFRKA